MPVKDVKTVASRFEWNEHRDPGLPFDRSVYKVVKLSPNLEPYPASVEGLNSPRAVGMAATSYMTPPSGDLDMALGGGGYHTSSPRSAADAGEMKYMQHHHHHHAAAAAAATISCPRRHRPMARAMVADLDWVPVPVWAHGVPSIRIRGCKPIIRTICPPPLPLPRPLIPSSRRCRISRSRRASNRAWPRPMPPGMPPCGTLCANGRVTVAVPSCHERNAPSSGPCGCSGPSSECGATASYAARGIATAAHTPSHGRRRSGCHKRRRGGHSHVR